MKFREGQFGTTVNVNMKKKMVKALKLFQSTEMLLQLYLGVNWANVNLLRGFSVLSMFNYKIKDYAPEMFFTYFLKASKLS